MKASKAHRNRSPALESLKSLDTSLGQQTRIPIDGNDLLLAIAQYDQNSRALAVTQYSFTLESIDNFIQVNEMRYETRLAGAAFVN